MCVDKNLYIDSLSYSLKGEKLLNSIYLELSRNMIIGILGKNGSGKSTLLNIIFGNIKPTFAYMKCDGAVFKKGYKTKLISFLPQGRLFPYDMLIKDILTFFSSFHNGFYEIDIIKNNLNNTLYQLSSGESRLVEILIVLYSNRPFCLLDEPFANLSPLSIDFIKNHIYILKQEKGILISDHNFRHVMELSDKICLLHNSNLVNINSYNELVHYNYVLQ